MMTKARAIYNHVYFFRDGDAYTIPAAGIAARTAKPDASDPNWIDLGLNESLEIEPKDSEQEVWGADDGDGQIVLQDVIETKRDRTFTMTCEQLPAIVFQKLFNAAAASITNNANAGQQYNPGAGSRIRGWMKLEQYDQDDNLVNCADIFVHFKVNGNVKFADTFVKAALAMRMLASYLNIGEIFPV